MVKLKLALGVLLGLAMIAVGVLHFVNPEPFVRIVPKVLPEPLALVYVSGVAEIAGGLGLLWSRTRRAASFGLIALYIAVFPANINMAVNRIPMGDEPVPDAAAWGRLPLQLVLIAWAYWVGRPERPKAPPPAPPATDQSS